MAIEAKEKRKEEARKYYLKHKEKVKAKAREYYHANREKIQAYREENKDHRLEKKKEYYDKNSEKIAAYGKTYRESNSERITSYKKNYMAGYYAENRSEFIARNKGRQSAQLAATPMWADSEKIKEFYFAADFLGMVTGEWYHVDHIVPLRSKHVCGLHTGSNLQVILASDNLRKGNWRWPDMP